MPLCLCVPEKCSRSKQYASIRHHLANRWVRVVSNRSCRSQPACPTCYTGDRSRTRLLEYLILLIEDDSKGMSDMCYSMNAPSRWNIGYAFQNRQAEHIFGRPRDVLLGRRHKRCRDHVRPRVEPGPECDNDGGKRRIPRRIGYEIQYVTHCSIKCILPPE